MVERGEHYENGSGGGFDADSLNDHVTDESGCLSASKPSLYAPNTNGNGHAYPAATSNGHSTNALAPPMADRVYMVPASGAPADHEDALVSNLFQVFWTRKWTILLCVITGLLTGVIYLSRATPQYQSVATIYMDQAQPKVLGDAYSTLTAQQSMATQVQLLTSTSMLTRAMDLPTMNEADAVMSHPNPVAFLRSQLNISPDSNADNILHVSMLSDSAQDNAIAVNALVQAFAEYHNDRRRSTAAEVLKVLQNESVRLNQELDDMEAAQLEFQQKNGTAALRTPDGQTLNGGKLNRLSSTLTEAELRHLDARLAYETALEIGSDVNRLRLIAASDPAFADLQLEYSENGPSPEAQLLSRLRAQRRHLVEVDGIGSQHSLIRDLDSQITMVESSMAAAGTTPQSQPGLETFADFYMELLQQRMNSAAAAEQEYRTLYDAEREQAIALNSVYAEYENIERQAGRTARQVEIIDERMRELNLSDDYDVIDVTVLEPALASSIPVSPNRSKILGMALILSLMLGSGMAYLQEMLDDRLRSGEEIASLLNQPILGVVPNMDETVASQCGQVVDLKPQSMVAESFRTIRTALHFNPHGVQAKVIMVTSPSPGDGKSTVASNLAIASAVSGKRTLLLDADCRKPRQHRIFELDADRGLTSLLLEKQRKGKKLRSPIIKTSIEGLDLMPCGPIPDRPSEMLNSARFAKLLEQLRKHYDQIIIDTPPTVPVSDSRIISSKVDGYVLVLHAGKSGRKMAKHATDLLGSVGAPPLGLVINGVTNAWGSYSYYSRYGYYQYGYGAYREEEDRKPRKLGRGEVSRIGDLSVDDVEALV